MLRFLIDQIPGIIGGLAIGWNIPKPVWLSALWQKFFGMFKTKAAQVADDVKNKVQ